MARARLRSEEWPGWSLEVRVLNSWASRIKGLLGTDAMARAVMLTRCSSVHTFGMKYALDLLFVGEGGEVLMSCRDVAPGEFRSCSGAFCVIERPSSDGAWPGRGEQLWVCSITADALCA